MTTTTIGMLRIILPVGPGTASKAAKAVIVVNTEKMTGPLIRFVPRMAVVSPSRPFFRSAKMFSPPTMASSTTIPSASTRASIENMLMEMPRIRITHKVPTNETTRPAPTHTASRISRNSVKPRKTRTSPSSPFSNSSAKRLPTSVVSSLHISTPTPAGSVGITSDAR